MNDANDILVYIPNGVVKSVRYNFEFKVQVGFFLFKWLYWDPCRRLKIYWSLTLFGDGIVKRFCHISATNTVNDLESHIIN